MPKTSEEAKERRREEILTAARRCFAEFGYEGATVARLEQATGLSRGAIFNYYASKDDIFLALANRDAERFTRIWLEHGFEEMLRSILAEDPAWLGAYLEIARRLRTDEGFREAWKQRAPELERRIEEQARALQASGELRGDVAIETIGHFMGIFADGLAIRVAAGFPTEDSEALIGLVAEAIRPRGRPAASRTRARRSA
jgi:AcrR family transcriptional regulator